MDTRQQFFQRHSQYPGGRMLDVLLVEQDHLSARFLTETMVASFGQQIQVRHVDTLNEALVWFERQRYDIALLDLTLPDSQGLATLNRAKQHARGTPIVVLDIGEDKPIGAAALDSGARDYLLKSEIAGSLLPRTIRYVVDRGSIERELVQQAAASIAAQEEERQWIAFEIHDRIAQPLASVFQQLQMLETPPRDQQVQARQVAIRASALLREAIRETRTLMNNLHPPLLDELGLMSLIEEELNLLRDDLGCQVIHQFDIPCQPPQYIEVALYRIFREALTNIRRHATGVRLVTVRFLSSELSVRLEVQDDGPGFDVTTATQSKRVGGLRSMRWRAEILGGTLEIVSSRGHGVQLITDVPMKYHD